MSLPLVLGTLIACGAGWLLVRPLMTAALAGMPPQRASLVKAGLLLVVAIAFFALRLAPFGVIGLVLAGGVAARAMRGEADGLGDGPAPQPRTGMSEAEALSVLGLDAGADAGAIDAAHRRMIVRAHPDQGGSDYLAAKVNEARAVLKR